MGIFSRRPDPYGSRAPYGDRVPPELERRRATARDGGGGRGGFPGGGRMLVALVVLAIPLVTFLKNCEENPYTGRRQSISMTQEQEIQLGLQAAPEMIQQHRGLHPDPRVREVVELIGQRIVRANGLDQTPYRWQFHALADANVVNAFALPGGQVFITDALMRALAEDGEPEPRIAGVLGHEIGHVIGRHGAERMSKMQLMQGVTGAVLVATYDPDNASSQQQAMMAMMVGQLINMKWGRDQELESDTLGVGYMIKAGYHPEALIDVMNTLDRTAGKGRPPEFMSTHPSGEHRREEIRNAIEKWVAQNGPLPTDLKR
ncbi:MAG: M48 family metalloprotease [Planctomycetota bacterium]